MVSSTRPMPRWFERNTTFVAPAFADHGSVGELMAADGGNAEEMIANFAKVGIDYDKLAKDLQREGAESIVKDCDEMLASIASKSAAFKAVG